MKKNLVGDEKIVSGKAKKLFAAPAKPPAEELPKIIRRAVKNISVPDDLEIRVRNLLRKQL